MFDVAVDLLFWRSQADGFIYVQEKTEAHSLHFDWDPGWRLGVSYKLPHDHWDLSLIVTRIHTKAHGEAEGTLFATWVHKCIEEASARWRLHFGECDLALGRKIFCSPHFFLHPFFGARLSCIRQKFCVYYEEDRLSTKNKFLGGGLLTGIDASWNMPKGFYLSTKGVLAFLFGSYYIHESEKKKISFRAEFSGPAPIVDLSLGIGWAKANWDIHLSLEEHLFFDQTHLVRFASSFLYSPEDLALQGLTLGAHLHF